MNKKILIIDDDQGLRLGIKSYLKDESSEILEAFDGVNGIEVFEANQPQSFDFIFLDVDMPRMGGLEVLKKIKVISPATTVIMMTAYATIQNAVDAVKNGAYSYLPKPVQFLDLKEIMDRALEAQGLIQQASYSAPLFYDDDRKMVGHTQGMKDIFSVITRLSKVDTPVLVRGESGTGKELIAKAIHFNSTRKENKFVAVNCSAVPENLFESEFFGHEKGAFTGAEQRKIGKFQFAEGGTLFLDELGELPLHMQVKLLRVLQEKKFTPVGSNQDLDADVRIIAATNRNLDEMIKTGQFRDDLFYRLNVMPIFLPPLKDRISDIERLIYLFVQKFNSAHGKEVRKVNPQALQCLKNYSWPGNIRELENVIEHTFILNDGFEILLEHLPKNLLESFDIDLSLKSSALKESNISSLEISKTRSQKDLNSQAPFDGLDEFYNGKSIQIDIDQMDFQKQKEEFEKQFIIEALRSNQGKINQTAIKANIPKKTLIRKIEKYGIDIKLLK